MKKSVILSLFVLVFSCSKDDGSSISEGDRVISAAILGWRNIGGVCPAPKEINGLADIEVTFNGRVPSRGNLILQSRWKLPSDATWTYETANTLNVANLSNEGAKITIANGFCWGLEDSVVSCEFKYVAPSGEESAIVTIPVPRPQ